MTVESLRNSAERGALRSIINRFGRVCVNLVLTRPRPYIDDEGQRWSEDWNIDCDPLPPYSGEDYIDYLLKTDLEQGLQEDLNAESAEKNVRVVLAHGTLFVYNKLKK